MTDPGRSQPFIADDEAEIAKANGTIVWCDVVEIEEPQPNKHELR